jgi:hypothetical protein
MTTENRNIKISFEGHKPLIIDLKEKSRMDQDALDEDALLGNNPCPGNTHYKTAISYCRLYSQVKEVFSYFSKVTSVEAGTMEVSEFLDNTCHITTIKAEAQHLFYKSFWLIISSTYCSVLSHDAPFMINYRMIRNKEHLFYTLYSIFLVRENLNNPDEVVKIEKFQHHLELICESLQNLLGRFKNHRQDKDSPSNGLVLADTQIQLMLTDLEGLFFELRKKMNEIKKVNLEYQRPQAI